MDKVKLVLSKILEQAFWLVTIVVLATAAVGWFLATGKLNADYTTQRRAIEGEFKQLRQIAGNPNPPNDKWPLAVLERTKTVSKKVGQTWSEIYQKQKDQVLKWPEDLLGADFVRDVERAGADAEITPRHLRTYQNDINKEFPRLVQLVDAASVDTLNTRAAGGPKVSKDDDETGAGGQSNAPRETKVLWDAGNQKQIEQALHWNINPPTTLDVRNTQENLWVLRTLLAAIAKVNEAATGNYNAKVKRIDQIAIGPEAATRFVEGLGSSRIKLPDAPATQKSDGQDPGDLSGGGPKSLTPPGDGDDKTQAAGEVGRYVDATGKPIGTAQAKSEEFKRLPVYLRLAMDQREVTALIAELANAPLPVEVRQFRLNPGVGSGGSAGGGGGTSGHAPPRSAGSNSGFGGGASGTAGGDRGPRRPSAAGESDAGPFDSVIELHGVVYIYNPPDKSKLLAAADAAGDAAAAPSGDAATSEP